MFDKDKEVMRFPPYEEKGNKKAKYDQKILRYNMVKVNSFINIHFYF